MNEVGRVTLPRAAGGEHRGFNDFGGIDRAMSLARERMADDIVVALDWKDEERIKVVRDRLRACPLPVLLLPDRSMTRILSYSGNRRSAGLSLCLQRSPLTIGELAEKRLIDIALSLTAILLLLPLLILVAAAIKLDSSGPIIFRQWRNGFNGRPFRILKFRTMHVMEDGPVIKQAEKIDPRVTRVGRILRRTSADELPQLFNVLLGHMSLVGPRPHAMAHDSIYSAQIADYAFRHHVKPGLTGWAQVNGNRGETPRLQDMERRIKCDLWYINHRSLILDLKIILRTCLLVARGDPAH
jgi:Undecaprenyl-phosphate glucose phosphotransferase